jgi:methylmalonyl-CoA/ethylmalonyl-CoA epimerase
MFSVANDNTKKESAMAAVTGGFGVSRIGQIAMTVGDLPRSIAFYRDVLGMRFLFEAPPAMAFFDCGGVRLMMSLPEQARADAGRQFASIIYYAVDDIQQAARELEARGVLFEAAPHIVARLPQADLWMAFLRDPDRHLLAIMSEVASKV